MLKTVLDLVPIIEAIDKVKSSKILTEAQKKTIFSEMGAGIPADVFCKQVPQTLSIIHQILEKSNGSQAKHTTKEKASEATSNSNRNKSVNSAAQDPRGQSKVSSNASDKKKGR